MHQTSHFTPAMCLLLTPGPECSAHGICINISSQQASICECTTPGFSSLGDWRFEEGLDCDVYLPAILAIWSLVLIFSVLGMLSSSVQIIHQGFKNIRNNVFFKVHVSLLAVEIGWFITSIIRLSDISKTPVGTNETVTYIATLSYLITLAAALYVLFLFYTVHVLLLKVTSRITVFKRLCIGFFLIFSTQPYCALSGLYKPTQYDVVLTVFFVLCLIGNWGYLILSIIGFTPLLTGIDESIKAYPERKYHLAAIRWRISFVRKELTILPFISGLIYLLFATWPYLKYKIVYQYPIQVLLWIIMCFGISVLISASRRRHNQNDSETKKSTSKKVKQELLTVAPAVPIY